MPRRTLTRPQPKPPGTRCYVPGFLSDADQFAIDQSQLGIAPLAVASAGAGLFRRGAFKTPAHKVAAKQGPQLKARAIAGDNAALVELERLSRQSATSKSKAIYLRYYNEAVAAIGARPAPTIAPPGTPALPTVPVSPAPPVPGIGPITITLPGAPALLPQPAAALPGGEAPVPAEAAPTVERPMQAGLFGGDMGKLMIPGLILFALMQLGGKKRR